MRLFRTSLFLFTCPFLFAGVQKERGIVAGAERDEIYLPMLRGKRVAYTGNMSSVAGEVNTADYLLSKGVDIVKFFAPEHGFRGSSDAGEPIDDGIDTNTGIPIVSLYKSGVSKPEAKDMDDVDVFVFDMQDVGCRFYTRLNLMQLLMEAAAENDKEMIVFDRPNPNGFFIDGSVLEPECKSGIGYQPVPVVYGMTVGEYAAMINGEGWLTGGVKCKLTVIPLKNYDHNTRYVLPVPSSPNLRTPRAVNLYPSLCFFEGTPLSEGRGTSSPFEIFGSPKIDSSATCFHFIPNPSFGDSKPKNEGQKCWGLDLRGVPEQAEVNLEYILWAYKHYSDKENFFLNNKPEQGSRDFAIRAGNYELQRQIEAGMTAEEIKATWQPGIEKFKEIRKKYLLYKDFE